MALMISLCRTILSDGKKAVYAFAALSAAALGGAYIAEYGYSLQPCELCMYQRVPYGIVIAVGLLLLAMWRPKKTYVTAALVLSVLAFAANTVIAFYHTGVERKWWPSFLEGCTVPDMKGDITDVLAQIAATPAVRCDEIPWTDPVLGLSMANYNVALCLALTIAALYALIRQRS